MRTRTLLFEHECNANFLNNPNNIDEAYKSINNSTPLILKNKNNYEIEGFYLPIWKVVLITDKELFSNNLDQMGINFNHSLDPLTWIFDLFRATGSQAIELERFGIESLEYFDPKTIRDIINKELLDLSEAHHERYFKKAN